MIGQIAALLWVVVAAFVLVFDYYRDELSRLFSSVKLPGGIEFTFRAQLDDAISKRAPAAVSDAARKRVLRRATRDFATPTTT
jgi:hypothetical protein